jgi:hypothetical protein
MTLAMLMAAETVALAAEGQGAVGRVTVCMSSVHDVQVTYATQMVSRILSEIGVSVEWRTGNCLPVEDAIQVSLSLATRPTEHPAALAYAHEFEGTHIIVLYDRVKGMMPRESVHRLLAHVLVHEIAHVLQAVDRHSATGIMKARWQSVDYLSMQNHILAFTPADVDLIHQGMETRHARLLANTLMAAR